MTLGPRWVDLDDAPEWTEDQWDRAELRIGDTVRPGHPCGSANRSDLVALSLSKGSPRRRRPRPLPRGRPQLADPHERSPARRRGWFGIAFQNNLPGIERSTIRAEPIADRAFAGDPA